MRVQLRTKTQLKIESYVFFLSISAAASVTSVPTMQNNPSPTPNCLGKRSRDLGLDSHFDQNLFPQLTYAYEQGP